MTGSVLEKKKMWNPDVVTKEELDDSSASMELILRKSMCWVVAQSPQSKPWALLATELKNMPIWN
jgi:hypothetical protein